MESRTRHKGRQALEEFQRAHDEMGGAIAVRGFELEHHLAGRGTAQPFVAEGGTGVSSGKAGGMERER